MSLLCAARRRWLVLILVVALFGAPLGLAQRVTAANASLVLAALKVLDLEYADPVHPVPLLNAAIAQLRKSTNQSPAALPDISSGASWATAESAFAAEFNRAMQKSSVPETQLAYDVTGGMLASLHDSHTAFLDPKQYQESRKQLMGQPGFTGIGVVITSRKDASGDAWIFVEDVFPGSPADAAGLKRFDRIVEVGGHSLKNVNVLDASTLIRGPAGSTAALTVLRGSQDLRIAVVRAPISEHPVEAKFVQPGVAYIKLFTFSRGAGSQLRRALRELGPPESVHSIILDLRGNPGGLIQEAVTIGSVFLPAHSPLARITERRSPPNILRTAGAPMFPRTPLVVLIDAGSASASEILTGAFKANHRATIVGEKTAGALGGSVTVPLPEMTGMSVTVERITTPEGTQVEGVGIAPDVNATLTVSDMVRGEDTQLQAALRVVGALPTRPRVGVS
ncbi:MAG TPA: S41 family peptidase [bacterium]|nr:S41 family peptidase [bacterium]